MTKSIILTKTDLVKELEDLKQQALAFEEFLSHTRAVFTAVHTGGLLDAMPQEPVDQELHNAALWLLIDVEERAKRLEGTEGLDMSHRLEILAKTEALQ